MSEISGVAAWAIGTLTDAIQRNLKTDRRNTGKTHGGRTGNTGNLGAVSLPLPLSLTRELSLYRKQWIQWNNQKNNDSYLTGLPVPTLSAYSAFSVFIFTRLEKNKWLNGVFLEEKKTDILRTSHILLVHLHTSIIDLIRGNPRPRNRIIPCVVHSQIL
jgi:hypothetical protein